MKTFTIFFEKNFSDSLQRDLCTLKNGLVVKPFSKKIKKQISLSKFLFTVIALFMFSHSSKAQLITSMMNFDGGTISPWTVSSSTNLFLTSSGTNPSQSPYSASSELEWKSYDASSGTSAYLYSPVINWSNRGSNTLQIGFWWYRDCNSAYNTSSYSSEGVTVYINTTNSPGGTSLGFIPRAGALATSGSYIASGNATVNSSGWNYYLFNVPATYNGATNYIELKFYSQYGDNCYIDNLTYQYYCMGCSNCTSNFPTGTYTSPGATWTTVTTCQNGGQFNYYTLSSDYIYQWNTFNTSWNTQLTLYPSGTCGGTALAYDDDYGGLNTSLICYHPGSTGVRLLISAYSCAANSTCGNTAWRAIPNTPAVTASPASICSGQSTTLSVTNLTTAQHDAYVKVQWASDATFTNILSADAISITVSPTTTTTYYVRYQVLGGNATLNSNNGTITVIVSHAAANTLTDTRDCKTYRTVKIGTQTWMAENLNFESPSGSWCYNDIASNCTIYGRLYNWAAAKTACPTGWHLPTDAEWTTLSTYLGGDAIAGGALKSTTGWTSPNTGATNSSGFSALPGGFRNAFGVYNSIGICGTWWSATEYDALTAWYRYLSYSNSIFYRSNTDKDKIAGWSVRCIKDY